MRCNGTHARKHRLQTLYVAERRQFEKKRINERKFQSDEQQRLLDLHTGHNTRDFWRKIGKLGIQTERSGRIPMEVVDPQGEISSDTNTVISRWKNDFGFLFSDSNKSAYDDRHLENIKSNLKEDNIPNVDTDISMLNQPITRAEVERSMYRVN